MLISKYNFVLNCTLRIESTLFSLDVPANLPTTPGLKNWSFERFLHKQGPKALFGLNLNQFQTRVMPQEKI